MTNNIFESKEKLFDRWAPNYDFLLTTVFYQAVHKRLLEYVKLPERPNVLDLGCGTGRLLNRLADRFPELQGTGLDLSTQMLRQARQRNQHRPRLIFVRGNAESLPFADNQFDAVFNTISFLHYPNPERVFAQVNRVLRPQGYFYLVDWAFDRRLSISQVNIRFYSPQQREQLGATVGLKCLGHYYLLSKVLLTIFIKETE
ncbi:MAG: class I SAM-dependent methyltransferase [Hydrococcus sp. C42_A2020_068]|uniref:class I SAM-dependent methyltransferase n=1 Tax=Pleurocapsa sp. PCC 7327 TaxID=118163 RepID=UPI00029FC551|nr:class I SAM-dependent methyltransferase [Pleurocapsa sp. PCC 7327]AFY78786.1 methylase involved in ubiquinone/menaquinone biosynthesis [Pleurocapsa sp. PCC 7327]MBF2020189.1 class I SAM-dependent methyltransferase [Hydrococcus sp. C42_A2020_068]